MADNSDDVTPPTAPATDRAGAAPIDNNSPDLEDSLRSIRAIGEDETGDSPAAGPDKGSQA